MSYRELILDSFAGGGGGSEGIERALGRPVDYAWNHDPKAMGMHCINHPFTEHFTEDVFVVDPAKFLRGRPVGLAHFSPDCTDHSKAKGGKPRDKKIRGLVLVMLKWAKQGVRVMTMENVEEIADWGPLIQMWKKGKLEWHRDPQHKGRTWRAFLDCLSMGIDPNHPDLPEFLEVLGDSVTKAELVKGFGYKFDYRCLRGHHYGTPTIRNRLFMVARCDGKPIVWPAVTHESPQKLQHGQKIHRTIAECLDFTQPCPSIFLRGKAAKKARCRRPLARNTLRRVATGIGSFVIHAAEPFIVCLTHHGSDRIESVNEPAKTITGANRGEKALCCPIITEHANASNQRNMPANEPMRTACAGVKGGHFALVSANLMVNTTGHTGASASSPAPTIPTGGHHALITGTIVHTAHGETDKAGNKRRGRGARSLHECSPTITSSPDCALAAASMVKMRGDNVGSPAADPLHTISAGGTHHGLVAAYIAQHNGGFNAVDGRPADAPLSTLSTRGSQQQLVAASMAAYYGSEADGQAVTEPARTVTTKARLGEVESTAVHPLTAEQLAGARRVAKFLRSFGVQFEGEFATVKGHVIVDIGMRMLMPRELFLAQGFDHDYVIDRAWVVDPVTGETREVKLTKAEQIRMCGNSVCPPVMEALVKANVPELIVKQRVPKWRPTLEQYQRRRAA